jgi:L-lactate dehydrogenase complex protein LldG
MTAREQILSTVRRHLPASSPLPDLAGPWISYPDPLAQYTAVLEMIGGRVLAVARRAELAAVVNSLSITPQSRQTLSLVPEVPGTVAMDEVTDPHDLAGIDIAILPGEFAVAENAAVWVTDAAVRHRVVFFLCQHLILVVPATEIVNTLGAAYERLQIRGQQFGAFIAGPSKTADIEQSLVIGAHGPKSLTVLLVGG